MKIYNPIQTEMDLVEQAIASTLRDQSNPKILDVNDYVLQTPGKRLRPALAIFSYRAFARDHNENLIRVAAAIELIHMASLLHDDVIDDAPTRHNQPSVFKKWNPGVAITTGVLYYSLALRLIADTENMQIIRIISDTVRTLCEGELFQILERGNMQLDIDSYLEVLQRKTAVLFGASCKCGALLAGASEKEIANLEAYGSHLGIVFQIVDDYLDIMGDEKTLKKAPGQDLDKGEITLPVLYLLESSDPPEKDRILHLISSQDNESLIVIRSKIQASEAPEKTKRLAFDYLTRAEHNASLLPESTYKNGLIDLAQFVRKRGFE